jgi:hypothetical protein
MNTNLSRQRSKFGLRHLPIFTSLLLLLLAITPIAFAQTSTTGAITGRVTDQSGAVIPNATVLVKNVAQGSVQKFTTNSAGGFRVPLLSPGAYLITVQATGFQTASAPLTVFVGQVATVNLELKVGATATTVTVTGAEPLIQTQNTNMAASVTSSEVSNLPNGGQDITGVVQSSPGAVMNTQGGYGNFETYGMPATSNLFTIDGMPDNDPFFGINNSGATNLLLGQSDVREVAVVNNAYSGQYGGYAGSNINYVSKSGSNAFHGSVNYMWNGRVMNANDWFSNQSGTPRSFDNVNQYSASAGGPIIKNHVFFYGSYEGIRILLPTSSLVDIPSPQFAAATLANIDSIFGPNSASAAYYKNIFNLYQGAPGANNAKPGSFPGDTTGGCPAGANFLGSPFWVAGSPCVLNFRSGVNNLTHEWLTTWRIDWNASSNDKVFGRVEHDHGLQATYTDPINKVFNDQSDQPAWSDQLNWTHTFGATTVNQFLLTSNWYSAIFVNDNPTAALNAFPATLLFGDGSYSLLGGIDYAFPQGRNITQYGISDDMSRLIGNHTLKLGVQFYRYDTSDHDYGFFTTPLEVPVTLDAFFYGGTDPAVLAGTDASPDYSLLEQAFPTSQVQPLAQYSLGGYVEDDYQAMPNLLLSFAFRLDHPSNPVCQHLCMSRLAAPFNQIIASTSPSVLANTPYNKAIVQNAKQALSALQNIAWEPRLGFAWQPLGSGSGTVIRGGFGIFADGIAAFSSESMSENPPYYNFFVPFFDNLAKGETSNLFSDAVNSNQQFVLGFAQGQTVTDLLNSNPFFSPPTLNVPVSKLYIPIYEKWNIEVQHEFGRNTSVSANYVGNHGYHEFIENPSANAFGFANLPANAPDPMFGEVNVFTSGGVSNYNGVTLGFTHRYSSGLVQLYYTWSHAFDIVSNGGALPFNAATAGSLLNPQNPNSFRASYGPADYDVRHNFIAKYVWELPIKRYLTFGHGPSALLNGWQVSGTIFLRSGLPYTPVNGALGSALNANNFYGPIYANDFTGSAASCSSPVSPCLKTSQFQAYDAQSTFGNVGRNSFRGPAFFDTDFSIMKYTSLPGWEQGKLGIGFNFYNVFNHPNFDLPVNDISSSRFGTIQAAVGPPTSIFASFLGGDASPRLIQVQAKLTF